MKITNAILFVSTIIAAPTRQISQELEIAPTTDTIPEQTWTMSIDIKADSVDLEKEDFSEDEVEFGEYIQLLESLPEKEWEAVLDSMTVAMEERLGMAIDELDKLSDNEFESLLNTM